MCDVPALRFPEFSGEWERTTLGKIGDTFNGLTGKRGSDFGHGSPYITYKSIYDNSKIDLSRVEYVQITDDERRKKTQNEVQYGDVFFTTSSETPNEVGMSSVLLDNIKDCYLNSFSFGYRLKSLKITMPEYMRFYLRSQIIRKKMYVLAQGSTRFNISKGEVMGLSIKIPTAEEQNKIAVFLSLIDERISTQNKIIEDLKKLMSAIYQEIFGSLVAQTLELGQVAEIIKGKQVNGTELLEQGDYYVMNGGTAPSGWLNKYNTEAYTISISEGGNSCGYVQYNTSPYWSGGHCYSLKIRHPQKTSDLYLYHFLKWQEENIMALRIGSGLPNIQKKDLLRFPIILPTITQQNKIVSILSAIEEKVSCEISITKYFIKQKQYLLGQLFI